MAKNFENELALSMKNRLDDKKYNKVFEKPHIEKTASEINIKNIFNKLISISTELDEFGLSKSAVDILEIASSFFVTSEEDENDIIIIDNAEDEDIIDDNAEDAMTEEQLAGAALDAARQ